MVAESLRFAVPKVVEEAFGNVSMQVKRWIGPVREMRKLTLFRETFKNFTDFTFIPMQVPIGLQARKNEQSPLNGNNGFASISTGHGLLGIQHVVCLCAR
jgi:hypothetical protein